MNRNTDNQAGSWTRQTGRLGTTTRPGRVQDSLENVITLKTFVIVKGWHAVHRLGRTSVYSAKYIYACSRPRITSKQYTITVF